jgi:hypothetical protein
VSYGAENFHCYVAEDAHPLLLSSTIIEELKKTAHVAYFYCDFRDSNKQSARGLLASLCYQLGSFSASSLSLLRKHHSSQATSGQPNEDHLLACLIDLISAMSSRVFVVVDALDECPQTNREHEILPLLERLAKAEIANLCLLVTSRPEADIRARMCTLATQQIDLHTADSQEQDLRLYVSEVLHHHHSFRSWRDESLIELAVATLSENAHGM